MMLNKQDVGGESGTSKLCSTTHTTAFGAGTCHSFFYEAALQELGKEISALRLRIAALEKQLNDHDIVGFCPHTEV